MTDSESKTPILSAENHLAIDERIDCWSPWGLELGARSFQPHGYIAMCLKPLLGSYVPSEIRDMFDRAKAIMSYGIYHYPLFTAGDESISMLMEAAIFHFAMENGCTLPKERVTFWQLIGFCEQQGFLQEPQLTRWQACRQMRNMVAHQKRLMLQHPNGAVTSLNIAKELIEALFVYGPPNYTRFYRESAEFAERWHEVKTMIAFEEVQSTNSHY